MGRMWRRMMWPRRRPMTRARSTNARSLSDSVWLRMIRAVDDQLVIPITIDDHEQAQPDARRSRAACPSTSRMIAARMIARTNVGRTRKKSAIRIRMESNLPPT